MKEVTIPLSDIAFDQNELRAVSDVVKSKWLTMGEITGKFEKEFGDYVGCKNVIAVNNCTAALHLAVSSLGVGPGDEVIVPSLTFIATANSVLYTGAKPVFADINSKDDWNIDPESIESLITDKTKAIIVVHFAGYPCDMTRICLLAKRYNLYVIEDAAHGPGTWYHGKHIGTIGDIGCFSFFANKNLTCGEGGALITHNSDIASRARVMRSHGMTSLSWDRFKGRATCYDVVELGFNYRFDEIKAAIAREQLKKLNSNNNFRKKLTDYYVYQLTEVKEVNIPFSDYNGIFSHHIFPILLDTNIDRTNLMNKMRFNGIQTSVHYPPIHKMKIYREKERNTDLPNTDMVGDRELTLPLHPLMKENDIDYIVAKLKESIL